MVVQIWSFQEDARVWGLPTGSEAPLMLTILSETELEDRGASNISAEDEVHLGAAVI